MSKPFEQRQAEKAKLMETKAIEQEMINESKFKAAEKKRISKERSNMRLMNEMKSTSYQIIKPEKIKNMSKKQLRMIKKTSVNKEGVLELVNPYGEAKTDSTVARRKKK